MDDRGRVRARRDRLVGADLDRPLDRVRRSEDRFGGKATMADEDGLRGPAPDPPPDRGRDREAAAMTTLTCMSCHRPIPWTSTGRQDWGRLGWVVVCADCADPGPMTAREGLRFTDAMLRLRQ